MRYIVCLKWQAFFKYPTKTLYKEGTGRIMARARKPQPTLESIFFSTPEQKVLRLLISNPTTVFTPRVISSKLKGVRGLGGSEGIVRILKDLETLGIVEFVNNQRSVRLLDDSATVGVLKTFGAICDLEGLKKQLEIISTKGVLYGSRATGRARSDSDYDLFIVSDSPEEIERIVRSHPKGKFVEVLVKTQENYATFEAEQAELAEKVEEGILLWGSAW